MFGKITSFGAMLALFISVGSVSAKPSKTASCCVEKTRCCDQPKTAACCKSGTACCDRKGYRGPKKETATSLCPVTGLNRSQCCASKASPMPPCCAQGCDTPGQILR